MKKSKTNSLFNIFHTVNRILGLVIILFLCSAGGLYAQNQSPEALRQQMAKIRQSTDWNDPVAAKKANDEIRELSKKLMMNGNPGANMPQGLTKMEAEQMHEEGVEDKLKLWDQMMTIAREGGAWDLAKPLREEIVQEYKDDESLKVLSPEFLEEMTFLCIDMSMPGVQEVIDQMESYKSIKTLLITGGKHGATVDLELLVSRASKYPLEQLYIINFRNFVTSVPLSISNFQDLTSLTLYNNKISQLPANISSLISLKNLYVDMNPIATLTPAINTLKNLESIGIAKTLIVEDEIAKIRQQLPNCKILLK
jgi:hypothetical protein